MWEVILISRIFVSWSSQRIHSVWGGGSNHNCWLSFIQRPHLQNVVVVVVVFNHDYCTVLNFITFIWPLKKVTFRSFSFFISLFFLSLLVVVYWVNVLKSTAFSFAEIQPLQKSYQLSKYEYSNKRGCNCHKLREMQEPPFLGYGCFSPCIKLQLSCLLIHWHPL